MTTSHHSDSRRPYNPGVGDSPSSDVLSASGRLPESGRNTKRLIWILIGSMLLLITLALVGLARRGNAHYGDRNQGPANEAAPGVRPSRDIDRSSNR